MELFRQEYTYNSRDLLEAMINLSEANISRFRSKRTWGELDSIFFGITSYDTGRQTGKSTTLVNYLKESSPSSNVFIVTKTGLHAKNLQHLAQSRVGQSRILYLNTKVEIFRGMGAFTLIFDECSTSDIRDFLAKMEVPHCIRAVVKVGSQ